MTNTQGNLLPVKVPPAHVHDTVAECEIFRETVRKYPSLQGVFADAGYRKTREEFVINALKKH